MTVVDVNTGKFTGSGGNLEETVTKNNLEAAEEIVRQLRLRDIGGIIVVDFIDMVLESNRDLVLRRLVECLGRDRTRHQVAEVTSLGLVQMTRKRIGTGLLEAFSHDCEHCKGRGVVVQDHPVEPGSSSRRRRTARAPQPRWPQPRSRWRRQRRRRQRRRTATATAGEAAPRPSRRPPTWRAPGRPSRRPSAARPSRRRPADQVAQAEEKPSTSVTGTPSDTPPEPVRSVDRRADDVPRPSPRHARGAAGAARPSPVAARAAPRGHQHPSPYGATPGRPAAAAEATDRSTAIRAGGRHRGPPPRRPRRGRRPADRAARSPGPSAASRRPTAEPDDQQDDRRTTASRTTRARRRRVLAAARTDQAQGVAQALNRGCRGSVVLTLPPASQ